MTEENVQQEPDIIRPGQILREGRQKAGFTQQDIASKLHLRVTNIADLEQDVYDENISLTFTKGYLKLYAREVGVSEELVVGAFEALTNVKKEPAKLKTFSRRVAKQANDDRLMLLTSLIFIVVIALVIIWWFQQDKLDTSATQPQSTNSVQTASVADATDQQPAIIESADNDVTAMQSDQADDTETGPVLVDDAQNQLLSSPSNPEQDDVTEEIDSADVDTLQSQFAAEVGDDVEPATDAADVVSAEPGDTLQVTTTELVSEPAQQLMLASTPVELVFEFEDDCWMNLEDASGEAIAYGVKKAGRVMPVSGIPPFEVTLGAPTVVKISYDGQPVDLSSFDGTRTARFSLPMQVQ